MVGRYAGNLLLILLKHPLPPDWQPFDPDDNPLSWYVLLWAAGVVWLLSIVLIVVTVEAVWWAVDYFLGYLLE